MNPGPVPANRRLLHSYLIRVLEARRVPVGVVFEVHDLASGRALRFTSWTALRRFVDGRSRGTLP